MSFSVEDFRTRFWAATAQSEKVQQEQVAPLQAAYDAKRAQICELQAELAPLKARLREARAPLVALNNEAAAMARALKGKVGERPVR